eukprot:3091684-Pyramimonas_sp.AAC.1
MRSRGPLGPLLGRSWALLGPSWGHLGPLGTLLGRLGASLRPREPIGGETAKRQTTCTVFKC